MPTRLRDRLSSPRLLLGIALLLLGAVLITSGRALSANKHPFLGDIVTEIGLVSVGTICVTYLYEQFLAKYNNERVLELVAQSLIPGAIDLGLETFMPRPDFEGLFASLKKDETLLWLDTYCPGQKDYEAALFDAVKRGASIHMLAIDPDSQAATWRAQEISTQGYSPERFREEATSHLRGTASIVSGLPAPLKSRIRVRIYNDLACVPMYIVVHKGQASRGLTSFFLRTPTFRFWHARWRAEPNGMLQQFHDYFDHKWTVHADTELDLEWFSQNDQARPSQATATARGAPKSSELAEAKVPRTNRA